MAKKKLDDMTVTWSDSQAAKDKAFEMLLAFYFEYEAFCGESICQRDNAQIYAPYALSDIAEKAFKFKVKYDAD